MRQLWSSLRTRLAVLGFLAIYAPLLLLFGIASLTDEEVTSDNGVTVTSQGTSRESPWVTVSVIALAPIAAGLAWWWAGRAIRPIKRVQAVAEEIEGSDLSRRIGLQRGPAELVSLAASFDGMFDRLEQSARTQRELIDEASHELRTPLAVLATGAEVLLAHPQPTIADYRQGLERTHAAAERMQQTIDALLSDARRRTRTIDRQPADLVAIARRVLHDAQLLAAPKHVELSLQSPTAAIAPIDEPSVERAVYNLVDNAVRYAPPASTVTVRIQSTENTTTIAVTDHGPGIAQHHQERAFERYWHERPDGTGLGLPLARQVALGHGGDLTLTSPGPAGPGCVFELRLPH